MTNAAITTPTCVEREIVETNQKLWSCSTTEERTTFVAENKLSVDDGCACTFCGQFGCGHSGIRNCEKAVQVIKEQWGSEQDCANCMTPTVFRNSVLANGIELSRCGECHWF